jgi:hypothetical protein
MPAKAHRYRGEIIWLFKIEDLTELPERCTRLSVPIAKRNAKFPSNPEKTVRCIAGTAFPNIKMKVAKDAPGREFV